MLQQIFHVPGKQQGNLIILFTEYYLWVWIWIICTENWIFTLKIMEVIVYSYKYDFFLF